MPTINQIHLINPTNLNTTHAAVNNVYPGVQAFNYSKRGPRVARSRLEGELTPTIAVQVGSNEPVVNGSIQHTSSAIDALAGTLVDQMEVTGFDGVAGATVTKRFTNVQFDSYDETFNNRDFQNNRLSFTADSVATV